MSFICNLFVIYLCFPPKKPTPFVLYRPHQKTLFRMTQSSNLVVSIVKHVYSGERFALILSLIHI